MTPCSEPSTPIDVDVSEAEDIQLTGVSTIWVLRGREISTSTSGDDWLGMGTADRDYARMLVLGGLDVRVALWGHGNASELTFPIAGSRDPVVIPIEGPGPVATVEGANDQGMRCALTESGDVWCWGANGCDVEHGPMDAPAVANDCVAVDLSPRHARTVELDAPASDLAVGWYHACVLTQGGAVWCWGSNYRGQLGDGTWRDSMRPVRVTFH